MQRRFPQPPPEGSAGSAPLRCPLPHMHVLFRPYSSSEAFLSEPLVPRVTHLRATHPLSPQHPFLLRIPLGPQSAISLPRRGSGRLGPRVFSAAGVSSVQLSRPGWSVTTLLFTPLARQHSRSRKRYHMAEGWTVPEDLLPRGAPRDSRSLCERKGTDGTRVTYPAARAAWSRPQRRLSLAAPQAGLPCCWRGSAVPPGVIGTPDRAGRERK